MPQKNTEFKVSANAANNRKRSRSLPSPLPSNVSLSFLSHPPYNPQAESSHHAAVAESLNLSWADSIISEKTVSNCSNTSFSNAHSDEVNARLGINLDKLESESAATIEKMVPNLRRAPDLLLNRVYVALCNALTTRVYPALRVNEQTKSSYVNALLEAINLYFIEEQKVAARDLEIVLENPAKVEDWKGRMDYAIVRRIKERKKAYYFVVECKADDPLGYLKQSVLYLKDCLSKHPRSLVGSDFICSPSQTESRLVCFKK